MNDKTNNDYDVGYKKPPKSTQFKPGHSGNVKGRPKGTRNFKTDVKEVLNKRIKINDKGKNKTINTQQAALLKLAEGALKGDVRKIVALIKLSEIYNNDTAQESNRILSSDDQAIIDNYLKHNQLKGKENE